jgi:TetR/AcrR family transcriptional regulator, transcriptional repressor for nem operon
MTAVTTDTRQEIMTISKRMVQARGYNALSFREVAKEVGVKSASVHYHFPTKGDLGAALARRYTDEGGAYLEGLLAVSEDRAFLMENYTRIFRSALTDDNRMCLCGIMAAEHHDLPDEVRAEIDRFTEVNVRWLVKVLSLGAAAGDLEALKRKAKAIYAAIGGAQLLARGCGDISVYDQTVQAYNAAGLLG